jgi:hypothetical protein
MISPEYRGEQFPRGEDNYALTVYMNVSILMMMMMMMMMMMQNCGMVMISPEYRGEQFPRGEDNSALTVYMNVTILAFPKIDVLKLVFSGQNKNKIFKMQFSNITTDAITTIEYTDMFG